VTDSDVVSSQCVGGLFQLVMFAPVQFDALFYKHHSQVCSAASVAAAGRCQDTATTNTDGWPEALIGFIAKSGLNLARIAI